MSGSGITWDTKIEAEVQLVSVVKYLIYTQGD